MFFGVIIILIFKFEKSDASPLNKDKVCENEEENVDVLNEITNKADVTANTKIINKMLNVKIYLFSKKRLHQKKELINFFKETEYFVLKTVSFRYDYKVYRSKALQFQI